MIGKQFVVQFPFFGYSLLLHFSMLLSFLYSIYRHHHQNHNHIRIICSKIKRKKKIHLFGESYLLHTYLVLLVQSRQPLCK